LGYPGVDVRLAELQFRWSGDGVTWTRVGPVLDPGILSDEASRGAYGSFTGAFRLGGPQHDRRAVPAEFDFFVYRNL